MPISSTSIAGSAMPEQSTNSCTVMRSTRCDSAVAVVVSRSNISPGCSPAAKNRELPCRQAAVMRSPTSGGQLGKWWWR